MKRFILIIMTCLLLAQSALSGHGFAGHTPVIVKSDLPGGKGAWRSIKSVYDCDRCRGDIMTYDLQLRHEKIAEVNHAAVIESNCYFKIKITEGFVEEICCTPSQKFYVPAKKKWIAACELNVGDKLLTEWLTYVPIADIEFVAEATTLYALEVDTTHCYFVGNHAVLVHNMVMPLCYVSLSVTFGEGAAVGGASGGFFGPITATGGVIIGGIFAAGIEIATGAAAKLAQKLFFRPGKMDDWLNKNFSNSGAGPEDPRDPKKNKGATTPPEKPRDNRPDRSLKREIRSLKKQIDKHSSKLRDYIKDPDAYDNKDLLKNAQNAAQREDIIRTRIENLTDEINRFQQGIDAAHDELMMRGIKWNI